MSAPASACHRARRGRAPPAWRRCRRRYAGRVRLEEAAVAVIGVPRRSRRRSPPARARRPSSRRRRADAGHWDRRRSTPTPSFVFGSPKRMTPLEYILTRQASLRIAGAHLRSWSTPGTWSRSWCGTGERLAEEEREDQIRRIRAGLAHEGADGGAAEATWSTVGNTAGACRGVPSVIQADQAQRVSRHGTRSISGLRPRPPARMDNRAGIDHAARRGGTAMRASSRRGLGAKRNVLSSSWREAVAVADRASVLSL